MKGFHWRDKIAAAVCDALRPELAAVHQHIDDTDAELREHINTEIASVHVHLQAATETLAESGEEPAGTLTVDDRRGLHALRSQLGAKHNPPPDVDPRAAITGQRTDWQMGTTPLSDEAAANRVLNQHQPIGGL